MKEALPNFPVKRHCGKGKGASWLLAVYRRYLTIIQNMRGLANQEERPPNRRDNGQMHELILGEGALLAKSLWKSLNLLSQQGKTNEIHNRILRTATRLTKYEELIANAVIWNVHTWLRKVKISTFAGKLFSTLWKLNIHIPHGPATWLQNAWLCALNVLRRILGVMGFRVAPNWKHH